MVISGNIEIAGRLIGPSHPPYIIAELSGNHNGEINRAYKIMEAAKRAGADAIKLQTYTADTMTIDYDGPGFIINEGLWKGRCLYELYQEAQTPWEWHEALFKKARELELTIFSTPFDNTAVDFLEALGAPAYKIASFEVTDLPLIKKVASTGKPMIISTGMADLTEIKEAQETAYGAGCKELILLHCISAYPAPLEESNLRTIADMAQRFETVVGLSDHTLGVITAVAGIAAGASVIEKHVTLKRADGGPDAAFSLEPSEFQALCQECKNAWAALGGVNYDRKPSEESNVTFRRSIYVVKDIEEGEVFCSDNIRSIRPGFGLPPKYLPKILGKRAVNKLSRGTPLEWAMIEELS